MPKIVSASTSRGWSKTASGRNAKRGEGAVLIDQAAGRDAYNERLKQLASINVSSNECRSRWTRRSLRGKRQKKRRGKHKQRRRASQLHPHPHPHPHHISLISPARHPEEVQRRRRRRQRHRSQVTNALRACLRGSSSSRSAPTGAGTSTGAIPAGAPRPAPRQREPGRRPRSQPEQPYDDGLVYERRALIIDCALSNCHLFAHWDRIPGDAARCHKSGNIAQCLWNVVA